MSLVVKFEDGYKIADRILYGVSVNHKWFINCKVNIGPAMHYDKHEFTVIDFPGEYDIDGVLIDSVTTKDDGLHYVFQLPKKKYVIVNKKWVLKDMDTNGVDCFFSTNDKMQEILEKLEYDGDFELLWEGVE